MTDTRICDHCNLPVVICNARHFVGAALAQGHSLADVDPRSAIPADAIRTEMEKLRKEIGPSVIERLARETHALRAVVSQVAKGPQSYEKMRDWIQHQMQFASTVLAQVKPLPAAPLKPLSWHIHKTDADGQPVEMSAHALGGFAAYSIRRMRDGRFAWTRAGLHEDAVSDLVTAMVKCTEDRDWRIKGELL